MLICSLLIALKVIDLLQLNTLQSVLFVADAEEVVDMRGGLG